MCECGCRELTKYYQLPGPNETVYMVGIFPGCRDCDAPPSLLIDHYTAKQLKDFPANEGVPTPKWLKEDYGNFFTQPILTSKELLQNLLPVIGDFATDPDDPITVEEVLPDELDEILTRSVMDTIHKD